MRLNINSTELFELRFGECASFLDYIQVQLCKLIFMKSFL